MSASARAVEAGARARAAGTAGEAVAAAAGALAAAGCASPRLDAELLVAEVLGVDRAALARDPGALVPGAAARRAAAHVRRRAAREPVAYILGRRPFRRLELAVDRRVLIPRPETEWLVEAALAQAPAGGRVHDVGTGSGAVALALKDERPDLRVSASDPSAAALAVARANRDRLGLDVELVEAPWLPPGRFDLVVANLPYVPEGEWPSLAPEITRYEPREALVAGPDGLAAIRGLVGRAAPGTLLALEHARGQAAAVRALLRDARPAGGPGAELVTVGLVP